MLPRDVDDGNNVVAFIVAIGVPGVGIQAASAVVGAEILKAAGHENYSAAGAAGRLALGSLLGFILLGCGFGFHADADDQFNRPYSLFEKVLCVIGVLLAMPPGAAVLGHFMPPHSDDPAETLENLIYDDLIGLPIMTIGLILSGLAINSLRQLNRAHHQPEPMIDVNGQHVARFEVLVDGQIEVQVEGQLNRSLIEVNIDNDEPGAIEEGQPGYNSGEENNPVSVVSPKPVAIQSPHRAMQSLFGDNARPNSPAGLSAVPYFRFDGANR